MLDDTKNPNTLPKTDMSSDDLTKIQAFEDAGLPGLAKLDEQTLYRMTDLYLNGSTYRQIARSLNLPKALVLYVGSHYDWYGAKKEYLAELQKDIKDRVTDSKLVSQEFLLLLVQAYQKKIGKNLQKYLATEDSSHTEDIDLKEIDKLLKTIEMLNDISNEGKSKGKAPAVGLNVGEGVTIERDGDNKVTITPKEKTLGDMLKKFADSRRAEANKGKSEDKPDIEVKEHKTEE